MAIDFEKLKANAKKKDEATNMAAESDFAKAKKTVTTPATKSAAESGMLVQPLMTATGCEV